MKPHAVAKQLRIEWMMICDNMETSNLFKLVVGHNWSAHGQKWRLWIKISQQIEIAHGVVENALGK